MGNIIIIAPHPDDEIIGCHAFLGRVTCICYGTPVDQEKLYGLAKIFDCETLCIKEDSKILKSGGVLFFPDPHFEVHPAHRYWGAIGERIMRHHRDARVIFYSVNMQAPYIFEVPHPEKKRELLNTVYPEKADLWKYDHKYFLFEGYCEWGIGERFKCD